MPDSPVRVTPLVTEPISDRERRAVAARRQMEGGLLVHTLQAHFQKEAARIDAETVAEASKAALIAELDVLDWGVTRAQAMNSTAGAKLVSDRLEQLSRINSQNLTRRFGA